MLCILRHCSLWCYFHTTYLSVRMFFLFFFNDTATTEIYTLSLHDALPISRPEISKVTSLKPPNGLSWEFIIEISQPFFWAYLRSEEHTSELQSHWYISYAVFCLKKKTNKKRCNPKQLTNTSLKSNYVVLSYIQQVIITY